MTSARIPPTVGIKHYAKIPLKTSGKQAWEAQDSAKAWSDAGEVRASVARHMDQLIADLEGVVARNATLGASEYLSEGEASLAVGPDGDLLLGVRIYSDEAALIAHVSLQQLIVAALQELRPSLGIEPQAQAVLSQLVSLGRKLSTLGTPPARKSNEETAA